MPLNWMDVSSLSFNTLLLLERVQLSWFPGWVPQAELSIALRANPAVEWYMRHKCPDLAGWLDEVMARENLPTDAATVRQAEMSILKSINDLVVYAVDPAVYDAQPFLGWDSSELTGLVNFADKTALDIGSGTGRLALTAAQAQARAVFAIEPVANLRRYIKQKARARNLRNVFAVDGLVTDIPFPDGFAGVTMGGHVFGGEPEAEYHELLRVTRPGGLIILCPGNNDLDDERHQFLVARGFQWSRFEEPGSGMVRKYWKTAGA